MGKHGKHKHKHGSFGGHWSSSKDQWDAWQDKQHLGKSDHVPPGKTVRPEHHKMPLHDCSVDEKIATLLNSLNAPTGVNKVYIHNHLGCAYRAKGDLTRAREHFGIAAAKGDPESKEALEALR